MVLFSVISADFNGDGNADLAVANYSTDDVSILLGTGTGSFGVTASYTSGAGTHPRALISADFNGDGAKDLAVANGGTDNISVLLGTGNGSFGSPTYFAVGSQPVSLTSDDFNGDTISDLATTNWNSNDVSVLFGTGTGSFGSLLNFATNAGAVSIISADLNGDAKADLAISNYADSNNVSIYIGTGTGTFGPLIHFMADSGAYSLISADFNGDSKADLAVANITSNHVSVLLNCLSVGDLAIDNKKEIISVYPNPFSSSTTLRTTTEFQESTLMVYNSYGLIVKQINNITGQIINFQRDNLPAGIYFIRMINEKNEITKSKFIIFN